MRDRVTYRYTAPGESATSFMLDLSATGTLTLVPKGHAAVTRHKDGWRTEPSPQMARHMKEEWDKGKDGCFNPAQIGGVWVDLSRRVVLVKISYSGNDTCWEGDSDVTVLTW